MSRRRRRRTRCGASSPVRLPFLQVNWQPKQAWRSVARLRSKITQRAMAGNVESVPRSSVYLGGDLRRVAREARAAGGGLAPERHCRRLRRQGYIVPGEPAQLSPPWSRRVWVVVATSRSSRRESSAVRGWIHIFVSSQGVTSSFAGHSVSGGLQKRAAASIPSRLRDPPRHDDRRHDRFNSLVTGLAAAVARRRCQI